MATGGTAKQPVVLAVPVLSQLLSHPHPQARQHQLPHQQLQSHHASLIMDTTTSVPTFTMLMGKGLNQHHSLNVVTNA